MDKIELNKAFENLKKIYNQRKGQYDKLLYEKEIKEKELERINRDIDKLTKVKLVFEYASEKAREQAKMHIERLVTSALQSVFGPDISFEVLLEDKRDRPEAEFLVSSTYGSTHKISNKPEDSRGGGVVDIVSIALRSAMLEGMYPRMEGVMVYDEPAKHVSEEFSEAAAALIKGISEDAARQIIMITHNKHLSETGEISYRIELRDGVSYAEKVL